MIFTFQIFNIVVSIIIICYIIYLIYQLKTKIVAEEAFKLSQKKICNNTKLLLINIYDLIEIWAELGYLDIVPMEISNDIDLEYIKKDLEKNGYQVKITDDALLQGKKISISWRKNHE